MFFKQKIDFRAVLGNAGLLLHVPAVMAFCSLPVCLFFREYFAIVPLFITGLFNLLLGHIFYRLCFRPKKIHLWDAMLSAALGWFLCPLFSAIPYLWIAHLHQGVWGINSSLYAMSIPLNAFFEAFSGFTSTGLSMIKEPELLPHVLQWWRALTQWVGGVGLIVFVISFMEPYNAEFRLFYAETRSRELGKSLIQSGRMIWLIYLIYTTVFIVLFYLANMPLWDAICHTMTGVSTGGFSILKGSFSHYTSLIKVITILMMILGAMSFSIHYKVLFEKNYGILWKNLQNRLLYFFIIIGSVTVFYLAFPFFNFIDAIFQWVSALVTCGFSTKNLTDLYPLTKLFLIIGMIVGGATGSTVGGIKIRRVIYLAQAILLRIKSFTFSKEVEILKDYKTTEATGVKLPGGHKTERLYEASVLFILWIFSIIIGWFMLSLSLPNATGIDLLFDVSSALSNVGLSSGITSPELNSFSKWILIFLMWLGRLEIIPILLLFFSPFVVFSKSKT